MYSQVSPSGFTADDEAYYQGLLDQLRDANGTLVTSLLTETTTVAPERFELTFAFHEKHAM
jgi:hypothetical protein